MNQSASEWHKFPARFPPHNQVCYVAYSVSNGDGDGSSHLVKDIAQYDGFEGWRKFPTGGKFKEIVQYFWMFPDCPQLPYNG